MDEYFYLVDEANKEFVDKELVWAAVAYLRQYTAETKGDRDVALGYYPFATSTWNPKNPRNCLYTARALIDSEIKRIENDDD